MSASVSGWFPLIEGDKGRIVVHSPAAETEQFIRQDCLFDRSTRIDFQVGMASGSLDQGADRRKVHAAQDTVMFSPVRQPKSN